MPLTPWRGCQSVRSGASRARGLGVWVFRSFREWALVTMIAGVLRSWWYFWSRWSGPLSGAFYRELVVDLRMPTASPRRCQRHPVRTLLRPDRRAGHRDDLWSGHGLGLPARCPGPFSVSPHCSRGSRGVTRPEFGGREHSSETRASCRREERPRSSWAHFGPCPRAPMV